MLGEVKLSVWLLLIVSLLAASCSPIDGTVSPSQSSSTSVVAELTTLPPVTSTIPSSTSPSSSTTTATTATTTTTTTAAVPLVADPAEVAIITQQADAVVQDFIVRTSQDGFGWPTELKDDDPFGDTARYYLEFLSERRDAIQLVAAQGTWPAGWDDPSMYEDVGIIVLKKAGEERIVPLGDGVFYVEGLYKQDDTLPGGGLLLNWAVTLGDFHFRVEDGQAVLLDAVVWNESVYDGGHGSFLKPEDTYPLTGHWMHDLIVTDQLSVQQDQTSVDMTVKRAIIQQQNGNDPVYLSVLVDYANASNGTWLVGGPSDQPPTGEIVEAYNLMVEKFYAEAAHAEDFGGSTEVPDGTFGWMTSPEIARGNTVTGVLWQRFPSEIIAYQTGGVEIHGVQPLAENSGGGMVHVGTIEVALSKIPKCSQIWDAESEIETDSCLWPRFIFNE